MNISRRKFLIRGGEFVCMSALLGCGHVKAASIGKVQEFEIFPANYVPNQILFSDQKPVVSVVRINSKWSEAKGTEYATAKAIDLIGGMSEVTKGKERILLKPNLVNPTTTDTTNPRVIEALAKLMKSSGKEVVVGEAGAASMANIDTSIQGYVCRTKNSEALQGIQNDIFKATGYEDVSKNLGIPLVNLHVGNMIKMEVPDNFVFKEIYIHEAMYNADLICSVPMMKTHGLATVTLSMKNVGIGGYPGMMYGTVRSLVHKAGLRVDPTGTSSVTIDMVKANKLGLSVIDATTAMQGQGPAVSQGGSLVEMNLIIASKNALAADMVAANIMGFEPTEIDTFKWAWKAGMTPSNIEDVEVVGEKIENVQQQFQRAQVYPYTMLADWYGPPCG